ncbi:glycerophosphodiester phosphodiesterase GDPD6-like [Aricia agestis]|uniref:glycerophosphodiester phosphodiesterase GDPD6-like n=1 Tax=Aricia agestis TaxID=91739 RepID=UPI001C2017BE|nr:glycerophosphodiester phosphodiesterase GDPD6-like [Aricia agestis]XP_041974240.1 glycerophosphodiester phosphodiesterase GDPD6-like [Aricia agestis]
MKIGLGILVLLSVGLVSSAPKFMSHLPKRPPPLRSPDLCNPTVIAHRGASGYVPEHTLGSYSLAITMGADYIEPDLVMTKDGHLVARHDNELGQTTDVAEHPEFQDRFKNLTLDGNEISGWFTEDFTLTEIKTLKAIERIPDIRPGNARMNYAFQVPTFQEILDLVKSMQSSQRRIIGVYPEIKHSTHFKQLGLPMELQVVDTFHRNGYRGSHAPVYIQSFEVNNLKELKKLTNLRLLQLFESDKTLQPADQLFLGTNLTYGDMSTPQGLAEVAKYAAAVGPDKSFIIPRNEDNTLGEPTTFVEDAHNVGLKVHPYTFRAENNFLPKEYQSSGTKDSIGDFMGEIRRYLATGIDGLFSDQPDVPLRVRGPCTNQ